MKRPHYYSLKFLHRMRNEFQESLELLLKMGYNVAVTPGTAEYYGTYLAGCTLTTLLKPGDSPREGASGEVLKWLQDRRIDLVVNIPEGTTRRDEVSAGYLMRRTAVDYGAGLLTNIKYEIR